jgi:hypothetical protein
VPPRRRVGRKAVSHLLTKRPRLTLAVGLALAVLLALTSAVVATSYVRSGHAVKAVKVATDDYYAKTSSNSWSDVPIMAVTMTVPANTKALFLITFSAGNMCTTSGTCLIRALVNDSVAAPGVVPFGSPVGNTNSMQWLASPWPPGTYTIKIQYESVGGGDFYLYNRTLSVLRSVV